MARISARVSDLFGQLGTSPEVVEQQLQRLDRSSLAALERLRVGYGHAARVENRFGRDVSDARADLPPFGHYPPPSQILGSVRPFVGPSYSGGPESSEHASAGQPLRALLEPRRQRAAKLVRLVHTEPRVRTAVERALGEPVVTDGRTDGRLSVARQQRASQRQAVGTNVSALRTHSAPPSGSAGSSGMPRPPGAADIIDLFLAMDQAILDQAKKLGSHATSSGVINGMDLFPVPDLSGSGSTGGTFGMSGASGSTSGSGVDGNSVDEGVLLLKRMIDKREQMYNLYRSTFDKYNESAKAAIDAMRA